MRNRAALRPVLAGILVGGAVLCAGCGSVEGSADEAPASLAARSLEGPTFDSSSTSTSTSSTTTTVAPALAALDEPRVVITATDVVVPVLGHTDTGWLVRTPCRSLAFVTEANVVGPVHVVIDPGHGGSEPGAVTNGGLAEKDVNLAVAELVERKLTRQGVRSVRTRYSDVRVPLATRAEIADRLDALLLISIHHQGTEPFPESSTPGTEIYYQQGSADSKRYAGLLREEALEELGRFDITWFAGTDAGAVYRPHADTGEDFYGMVRIPETPAVLAEMSFLGNPAEEELLRRRAFLDAEATAIADAVVRYFATDDPGSGFVEPSFGLRSAGGGGGLAGCVDPDLGPTSEIPEELAPIVGAEEESG